MKVKKFAEEFKAFIAKGNVIDMAVAVIIGGAFGKIVTSLVNDIIMPLVGLAVGKVNFTDLKWVISEAVPATETTAEIAEVALRYGTFIQTVIDFLIIAFSVFVMLKMVLGAKDKLMAKQIAEAEAKAAEEKAKAEAEAEANKKPTAEELLTEIRDLLSEKK